MENRELYPHVSVDCVILGFDGDCFNVLLIKRKGKDGSLFFNDYKLPGSLIFEYEDLDEAARRVAGNYLPVNKFTLKQFKSFGNPDRISNPRDVNWLEEASKLKIGRIVTVAYLAAIRIKKNIKYNSDNILAEWVPVKNINSLAFDHMNILKEAINVLRKSMSMNSSLAYELLPRKFTIAQMRILYEELLERKYDVRNFYKKVKSLKYVMPLDEFEKDVSHRSARYYRFDKKMYSKSHVRF